MCRFDDLEIITGMALGWDTAVATACRDLGVPFIAALPFRGQDAYWTAEERRDYRLLLDAAREIVVIGKAKLNRFYLLRDYWIVDNSDHMTALDSGRPSGTHTTVLYAESKGRKVEPLWDDWIAFRQERNRHA